jgi:hypothetical protein
MLFGTNAWEVNNSYARGFKMICCACGWASFVNIDAPSVNCAIIECKREECGQVVQITDGEAEIIKPSKHISPTQAREMEEEVGQTS